MNAPRLAFGLAMAGAILWSFTVPGAKAFQRPELARVFFTHFPAAIVTSLFLFAAPYFAARYLASKSDHWDLRAAAANEVGFIFGLITMATGVLFSKVQWGEWWQNDPRQVSFMLVLLLFMAYFALRASIGDSARRASNSAAYSVATALPALFLIFVYPRLPNVRTFHPNETVAGGLLEGDYRNVTMAMVALFTALAVWIYRLRVCAGLLEAELENLDGHMESADGGTAPTGVVRPISVSRED